MKKLLLIAAVAASTATISAETFSDFFKLTCGDQVIENGQTISNGMFYDPIVMAYPEYAGLFPPSYEAKATIKATNVYDDSMNIAFVLTRTQPAISDEFPVMGSPIGHFQLCFDLSDGTANCLPIKGNNVTSPADMPVILPEEYINMDIEQMNFTDLTPTTYKLDLWVTEGGEKVAGTDCTVYVNFTHETDITAAVEGIDADPCKDCPPYYFTIDGAKVVHPEKGNMYIECKNGKVTKRIFK